MLGRPPGRLRDGMAHLQAVVAGETVEVSDQQVVVDVCEMVLGHLSERAEHQQRGGGGERRRGVSQARC